jgi:hypothetical protein
MTRKPEQQPAPAAPDLRSSIVRAHRRQLEARLIELRAAVPAAVLAKALGRKAAHRAMTELRRKIADVEFAIAHNRDAGELAAMQDHAAQAAWRAQIQTLPPEQIIAGIGKESCCGKCERGVVAGCVLAGGTPTAECWHPVKSIDLFHRTEQGQWIFPCRANPQASRVFDAALARLKLEGKFT